jgi:NAD(P)-dependent dehydrogenase (short-subunit alcohol dehydrogenase family)
MEDPNGARFAYSEVMPGLQGQVLIVTSSAGIGAATARLAAANGARIVVATGDGESGWELAAEMGAECWIGDLALPGAADSVVSQCLARFGRVDALFNAAGLSGRRYGDGPVDECTDEGWEMTLGVNLKSTFLMCRAVIRRLLQQEPAENGVRGTILNMGSVLETSPEPRHFAMHAYAAAKGGVIALSRSMAAYYAPHKIRVNVIAPGVARTPASERSQTDPELSQFLRKKQPLTDGMVDATDIAQAALFLLSEEARSITAQAFHVDGGWSVTGA